MMRACLLIAAAASALAAPAATTSERELARLTRGRAAGEPVDCILPEARVPPRIVGNTAIVFRTPRAAYVTRPVGACPELREDGQLQTSTISGQVCRNDHFRVTYPPGPSGSGLCAFGPFVPYAKAK